MVLGTMAAESTSTVVRLTQRFSDSPVLARRLTNHSMEMVKPRDYTSAAAVTAQLAGVAILTVAQVRLANLTAIMRGANFINPDGPDSNCCELLYARSV